MHDLFAALLEQPTARRYKQARSRLLATGMLGDFAVSLAELEASLEEPTAAAIVSDLLPHGLLSLRLHRLAGAFALQQADRERAELHRFTYDALCAAILSTGSGTRRRPLLITYASDAAELLRSRGLTVQAQSLIEVDSRRFDVLLCSNEQEFWFDITDLLPQTAVIIAGKTRPKTTPARQKRMRQVSRS